MCTPREQIDSLSKDDVVEHIYKMLRTQKEGVLHARLKKMGLGDSVECKRCGGSGRYQRLGSCYGCGGMGRKYFKLNHKCLHGLYDAEADGTLAKWLEIWSLMNAVKKSGETLLKVWSGTGISDTYDWNKAVPEREAQEKGLAGSTYHADLSDINKIMHDAHKRIDGYEGKQAWLKETDVHKAHAWVMDFLLAYDQAEQEIMDAKEVMEDYLAEQPSIYSCKAVAEARNAKRFAQVA